MRSAKYECNICGRLWKRETARMLEGKTCSKACSSIKGYLSGEHKETSIELKLQGTLLALGIDFIVQKPLLGITVADVFVEPNVVFFADGVYWHSGDLVAFRDEEKTRKLKKNGYIVARLTEKEINAGGEVLEARILEAYARRRVKKEL